MNDNSGAPITEDGVVVAAESDVGGHNRGVRGTVRSDDQGEIGNVAGGQAAMVGVSGTEVRPCGFEIGRFALCDLMNVEGMLAWWKVFDVQLDFDTVRRFREDGSSDRLPLRALDIYGDGFLGCTGVSVLRGGDCRRKETQDDDS